MEIKVIPPDQLETVTLSDRWAVLVYGTLREDDAPGWRLQWLAAGERRDVFIGGDPSDPDPALAAAQNHLSANGL
ncbi:hypothetical protein C5L38_21175 [Streptomyces sp. WAC00288]|uniref:hypothetical protein n=1 Tax=unclassified Streptomyces TaxID=2593676 RepID=UPI000788DD2F|nr:MULTISPECIES: hypothetical protein [unclassified Streptomyces]AVH97269.1 hypothetical protein C5L38_21175 [Streptomyces sp. WAC00288]KYG55872.1 hypothetical protein AWI43_16845 [Streptomyces sp. WAC04657]